jgi:acetyltransferase-like isoleucine patch superfamily enzyme
MPRYLRFLMFPMNFIWARLRPVSFAKKIGVNICGDVTIYGSSYEMFSTEPYLVTLGDNVFISIGASFVCHDGSTLPFRKTIPDLEIAGKIKVGNNVFIGKGALVLPNVEIGDNCIIGANSVVTKNIEKNSVVGGNPAKVIKSTDEYLIKAQSNSLKIGHLTGMEKVKAYKKIFGIKH